MSSLFSALGMRPHCWGLVCAALLAASTPASAQIGFGGYGGYGGYGGGFGGYGGYGGYGGGFGGIGYGGLGGGYGGYGGFGGFSAVGYNGYGGLYSGIGGSYGGFPLLGTINGYNAGYNNNLGIGLVPPAFVGTGTAGIGPIGIGGTNPLFGLGLSPLAIHNAVAEQALRQQSTRNPNYFRGYNSPGIRMNLYPPNTPVTAAKPAAAATPATAATTPAPATTNPAPSPR